jgi:hypothetical protein
VFLEIANVHDTEGRYARLYEIVDSKGIADLDDALIEADQPDLFRALHNAIGSLSNVETVPDLSKAEAIRRASIFSEMFFARLCAVAGKDDTYAASRSEAVRDAVFWLRTVLALLYRPDSIEAGDEELRRDDPRFRLILLVYSFVEALGKSFAADGLNTEVGRVIEEYLIAKKLKECAVELSRTMPEVEDDYDVSTSIEVAIAWALRRDKRLTRPETTLSPQAWLPICAHEILGWSFSDSAMRAALGVNHYRGIEYFNKERFETFVRLLPACAWIDSISPSGSSVDSEVLSLWRGLASQLTRQAEDTGYMTNALLEKAASAARA